MPQKVSPITPNEIVKKKKESFPPEVLEAFNEVIYENAEQTSSGICSTFNQNVIVRRILKRLRESGKRYTSAQLFEKHWLDVENVYRACGWEVKYDKPGYNEEGQAVFQFCTH